MKEQIIHLDPHDDYHSLRDKMGWAQTDRILLVLSTHERNRLRSGLVGKWRRERAIK